MISLGGAAFLVVGFVWLLEALKLPGKAKEAVGIGRRSLAALRDPDLADEGKEEALQRFAIRQFVLFFQLAVGGFAAVFLPAAVIWLLDLAGVLSFDAVMGLATSWEFLLASTLAVTSALWLISRR